MKEITILSGKGGTGKTSVTAALASIANNTVFSDNDVDAADLHLILHPEVVEEHDFVSGWKVTIDQDVCSNCGLCLDYCRFGAIHKNCEGNLEINNFSCEGCRLCERICPDRAITAVENRDNYWYVSNSRFGKLVHAKMGAGEENSGRLVSQVRKRAKEIAKETEADFILNDGPPGIGCATISSLSGVNAALVVTEPSKSAMHDAQRLVELIESFKVEAYAVINKFDLNTEISDQIERFFQSKNIPVLAKLPFDKIVVESMIAGKSVVEHKPESKHAGLLRDVWKHISEN